MTIIKQEAYRLELRLEITNNNSNYLVNKTADTNLQNEYWYFISFKNYPNNQLKHLLADKKTSNNKIFFIEPNFNILSFLSKSWNDENFKTNEIELSKFIEFQESSKVRGENFVSKSDDIYNWNVEDNIIEYIGFNNSILDINWNENKFLNHVFFEHRKIFLNKKIEKIENLLLHKIDPPLKFVCSSIFIENILNSQWQSFTDFEIKYKNNEDIIQPVLISQIKSIINRFLENKLYYNTFDRFLVLEELIFKISSKQIIKKNKNDEFDYLTILKSAEKTAKLYNQQQNILKLQKQEQQLLKEKKLCLNKFHELLVKATIFDQINKEDKKILLLSTDIEKYKILYQQSNINILLLDLKKIKTVDDLLKINISKYVNFSKNARIFINKKESAYFGKWILENDVNENNSNKFNVDIQTTIDKLNYKVELLKSILHPKLAEIISKYINLELPNIRKKQLLPLLKNKKNNFSNLKNTQGMFLYFNIEVYDHLLSKFDKILSTEINQNRIENLPIKNLKFKDIKKHVLKYKYILIEVCKDSNDLIKDLKEFYEYQIIYIISETIDYDLVEQLWATNSILVLLSDNKSVENLMKMIFS